jgi:uncharacterized membrane protein
MNEPTPSDRYTIRRIGNILHKIYPVKDNAGKVIHYLAKPLKVELRHRDLAQILVGASVLAIPVGFTEEVWTLGAKLPIWNVVVLALISIVFIALYVYFTFYRDLFHQFRSEYVKRVISIYLLSLMVVAVLMTILQIAEWNDSTVAIKRIVIIAFPASMGAAVSNAIS